MDFEIKPWHKYIAVVVFFGIWELITQLQLINPFFIPPVSKIIGAAWKMALSGELPYHALISLTRAFSGFMMAVIIAIPLGILMAIVFRKVRLLLEPLLEICSQTNPFIIFHIFLLITGVGEATKTIMITWTCIWPVLFSTITGVLSIDPLLVKSARAFGLNRHTFLRKVLIPAAAPAIYSGVRLSAGYSFFILIAVEMLGSSSGLGALILYNQEYFRIPSIFAAAGLIALLGLGLDCLLESIGNQIFVLKTREPRQI